MTKNELSNKVKSFRSKVEAASQTIADENVENCVALFPHWNEESEYEIGYRVQYDGVVYKCIQAHSAQAQWNPVEAVSLWAKVITSDTEILDWEQPGAENAYMTGDKVRFDGKIYESIIDNNVWSPTGFPAGWREI